MYVFGKGQKQHHNHSASNYATFQTQLLIQGTVTDQSPAQPGTPCVSAASMATEMQYLYMQYPIDGIDHNDTITGVPVTLTALDPNGNYITIGTVTSDGYYGTFSKTWTPTIPGDYKIIASFAGDDSYGSSSAATAISVGTPSATATAAPAQAATDYTMSIVSVGIGLAIVVIVSVAIATILILRKR